MNLAAGSAAPPSLRSKTPLETAWTLPAGALDEKSIPLPSPTSPDQEPLAPGPSQFINPEYNKHWILDI